MVYAFLLFGILGIIVGISELDTFVIIFYIIWCLVCIVLIYLLRRYMARSSKIHNIKRANNVVEPDFTAVQDTSQNSSVSLPDEIHPMSSSAFNSTAAHANDLNPKSSLSEIDSSVSDSCEDKSAQDSSLQKPTNNVNFTTEHHNIAGTSFRQNEIRSLGLKNDDYFLRKSELEGYYSEYEKIYQIDFSPDSVELIEEPDNPKDPNAIKVVIDDVHVGYIKKGSCAHIKKLMKSNTILKIIPDIHGGKYKYLVEEDDGSFSIVKRETPFFVSIYIYVSNY